MSTAGSIICCSKQRWTACNKLKDQLLDWLGSHAEQLHVFEDNDEIILKRLGDGVLLSVQLTSLRPDQTLMPLWMRLGAASLDHFQGALAQAPDSGALWLVQCLRNGSHKTHLVSCLESLLNQRDTWRATFTRLARPAQNLKPTSLRSLSY